METVVAGAALVLSVYSLIRTARREREEKWQAELAMKSELVESVSSATAEAVAGARMAVSEERKTPPDGIPWTDCRAIRRQWLTRSYALSLRMAAYFPGASPVTNWEAIALVTDWYVLIASAGEPGRAEFVARMEECEQLVPRKSRFSWEALLHPTSNDYHYSYYQLGDMILDAMRVVATSILSEPAPVYAATALPVRLLRSTRNRFTVKDGRAQS